MKVLDRKICGKALNFAIIYRPHVRDLMIITVTYLCSCEGYLANALLPLSGLHIAETEMGADPLTGLHIVEPETGPMQSQVFARETTSFQLHAT